MLNFLRQIKLPTFRFSRKPQLPAVKKEKLRIRVANYVTNIGRDYVTVARETATSSRNSPHKFAFWVGLFGLACLAGYTNPSNEDYVAMVTEWNVRLGLITPETRKPRLDGYISDVTMWVSQGRLRWLNLYLFSVGWLGSDSARCALPHATISQVQPPLRERVVDVAAFGSYFILSNIVKDYDVNDDSFQWTQRLTKKPDISVLEPLISRLGLPLPSRDRETIEKVST